MRNGLLMLLALGVALPAQAGLRATYSDGTQGQPLVVEVADNGDARVSDGEPGEYGLLLQGHFYMVGNDEGTVRVARLEDVADAMDRVLAPLFKGILAGAPSTPTQGFRVEKKGTRTVGGREGTVYAVYGLNIDKPDAPHEFVMSTDADLKPVGQAMEQFMNAGIVPSAPFAGKGAAEIVANTRAIFALGTPLDAAGRFRLVKVETVSVPEAALQLPAKASSVDELAATLRAARDGGAR